MPSSSDKKKIFISWSKRQSGDVARVLKKRLRFVLEGVDIFMSQADIGPGERSMRAIEDELDQSSFGILVVTRRNKNEPWLNFEAGALSKAVGNDSEGKPRVVPVLVDLASGSQLRGPIGQFQAVTASREGISTLVQAIGALVGMEPETVKERFEAIWTQMEEDLSVIEAEPDDPPSDTAAAQPADDRSVTEMLFEALEILRAQQQTSSVAQTRTVDESSRQRSINESQDLIMHLARLHNVHVASLMSRPDGVIEITVPPIQDALTGKNVARFSNAMMTAGLEVLVNTP